jgi:methylated-DNA-[protein]-cysteine S-methyltransferase
MWQARCDSPIGPLLLTAEENSLTGLYFLDKLGPDRDIHHDDRPWPTAIAMIFAEVSEQLAEYFTGSRQQFCLRSAALAPRGSRFQQAVWLELQSIPYGQTISYGELARRIGRPSAARAVGLANGRNPLSVLIPCHRVIGGNGSLIGYGGGLERKQYLLALETRVCAQSRAATVAMGVGLEPALPAR